MDAQNSKISDIVQSVGEFQATITPIIHENSHRSLRNEKNIEHNSKKIDILDNKIGEKIFNLDEEIKIIKASLSSKAISTQFTFSEPINVCNESLGKDNKTPEIFSKTRANTSQSAVFNIAKIPSLPIFDGNNYIASTFLLQVEDSFIIAGISAEVDKIQAFKLMVTGKVKNWLLGMKGQLSSWEELKIKFLKQWQAPFTIQRKLKEWKRSVLRSDDDVEAFVLDGLRLLEAIYPNYIFPQIAEEIVMKLPWRVRDALLFKYTSFQNEEQFLEALQQTLRIVDISNASFTKYREQAVANTNKAPNFDHRSNNDIKTESRPASNNYRDRNNVRGRGDFNNKNRRPYDRNTQINGIFSDHKRRSEQFNARTEALNESLLG